MNEEIKSAVAAGVQEALSGPAIAAIVDRSVKQSLTTLGVDVTNPIEMQRDLLHLREWRLTMAAVKRKGMLAMTGTLVCGALAALWVGLQHFMQK